MNDLRVRLRALQVHAEALYALGRMSDALGEQRLLVEAWERSVPATSAELKSAHSSMRAGRQRRLTTRKFVNPLRSTMRLQAFKARLRFPTT